MTTTPTTAPVPVDQARAYLLAFDTFNVALFDSTLPRPMLSLGRQAARFGGYFAPDRWEAEDGSKVHEISLNANHLVSAPIDEVMGILVHEMTHLAQHVDPVKWGKPGRDGWHSKAWVRLAESLGLDVEGSGQTVSTTPRADGTGRFWEAFGQLPTEALLPYQPTVTDTDPTEPPTGGDPVAPPPVVKKGSRIKYVCPGCGGAVWGGRGLTISCESVEHAGRAIRMAPSVTEE